MSDGAAAEPEIAEREIGWAPAIAGVTGILFFATVFAVVNVEVLGHEPGSGLDAQTVFMGFAGSWVGMWLGILWANDFKFRGLARLLGFKLESIDIPIGIGLGVAAQILTFFLFLPVKFISPDAYSQVSDSAEQLTSVATGWVIPPFVICVCILAPIFEELFFRGVMLKSVGQKLGSFAAIVVSACTFGIIHFENWETIALVAFGVILAIATLKTRRLGAAIVAHMLFNSVSVFVLLT